MNARTSRLLARVARVMFDRDPREVRQPEVSVLADLKLSWHAATPVERAVVRRGMVNAVNEILEQPHRV